MYCIEETIIASGGLPLDICRDKHAPEVVIRIAGHRLDGPLGNNPEVWGLLVAMNRRDIIVKWGIRPY